MKASLENIINFLNTNGEKASLQEETKQAMFQFPIEKHNCSVFFRIPESQGLIQIVAFLPLQTRQETISELARFLHLVNKEIDLPGFGMDESSQLIFYRAQIPYFDDSFDERNLNLMLKSLKQGCLDLIGALSQIISGEATYDSLLKQLRDKQAAVSATN